MMAKTLERRSEAISWPRECPTKKEESMWLDIAVTVFLTLRIALFRPALPQLMDPNYDARLQAGDVQEFLLVTAEK
jgi:hypothetical protein